MLHMPSVTSVVDANWHGATVNASAGKQCLNVSSLYKFINFRKKIFFLPFPP